MQLALDASALVIGERRDPCEVVQHLVRIGGQLGDLMSWELAPEKTAELLAEFQARAFQCDVLARGTAQIDQRKSACAFAEALDAQHQLAP
jgi:hypothetical protein